LGSNPDANVLGQEQNKASQAPAMLPAKMLRYILQSSALHQIVLLALTVSFDDFVITSMVAGVDSETLPMVIYAMARRGASPAINAISALIVVVFGALILLSERMTAERR